MKWLDIALIAALMLSVLPMQAGLQPAEALGPQAEEAVAPEPDVFESSEDKADEFDKMESILRNEEDMVQGSFNYDPGRRRDPFVSLARRTLQVERPTGGDCPTGCLIDEVSLTGIFVMPEGPVAQIQSPDQDKSYLIRVGDEFHDGDVVAITADAVHFRQMVNDYDATKPYREVTKSLNP